MYLSVIFVLIFLFVYFHFMLNSFKFNYFPSVNIFSNMISILVLLLLFLISLLYQLSNNNLITFYIFNSSYYVLGIDKLSVIFVMLTILLFILCYVYNIKNILVKINT